MKTLQAFLVAVGLGLTTAVAGAQDALPKASTGSNPFKGNDEAIKEGRTFYMKYGCSGCHGVGGGGGMGPPVTDDTWKFGSSDDVLFKLVKGQIPEATMPKTGASIPDEEVWKMLAYVRAQYAGDPKKVDW
jgi:cytochrome c(L)